MDYKENSQSEELLMKKFMKKMLVGLTAMSMALMGPMSAMAASFEDGEVTGLALMLYAQTGEGATQEWFWMDNSGQAQVDFLFNTPTHYSFDVEEGTYGGSENPMAKMGLQVYFPFVPTGGSLNMAVSFVNFTLVADGYDPIVLGTFTNDDFEVKKTGGGEKDLLKLVPEGVDLATVLCNLTRVEFDANVVGFDVVDADGNVVYHPGVVEEETEDGETVEGETPEETEAPTEAPTTAAPTTEAPTEAPTTAAPTEAATQEETETAEETKAEETKAEEKDDKNDKKSMIRIIITIAATVLLAGALVFVALLYRKNR